VYHLETHEYEIAPFIIMFIPSFMKLCPVVVKGDEWGLGHNGPPVALHKCILFYKLIDYY
jgi:hypothetical protein